MKSTAETFRLSLHADQPPEPLSVYLQSLWYERKGQWDQAHRLVDQLDGEKAARVHAYLHRREGDSSNAMYWYRKAGVPWPEQNMDSEWEDLVNQFIEEDPGSPG
jgi:hypothetical protein